MKVKAPKGYHWMKSGKGMPKLMKDPKGGYKPHKGASQSFNFEVKKFIANNYEKEKEKEIIASTNEDCKTCTSV